uniref:Uncharacterized protein n=1 Tax=Rhizophora mucronata TaxID=61149 RepID=A0A2P2JG43_RHIMU
MTRAVRSTEGELRSACMESTPLIQFGI